MTGMILPASLFDAPVTTARLSAICFVDLC
jgi:hypothetical protein